jgi:thiosulfate/3-mercaptopyruvate sulfurtransferase
LEYGLNMSTSSPLSTPLVTVDWLRAHHQDTNVVTVDCRFALDDPQQGRTVYEAGHIPGAFYLDLNIDLSSPVQTHGGRHPLPNVKTLSERLQSLGISANTIVIAYDASKGAFAARLWWLLRYLGHDRVAVLDGGFPAWQQARYFTTTITPETPPVGNFQPQIQAEWVVDRAAVLAHQAAGKVTLVDARSPERYRGEIEPIDPIAGSLPGAENLFWQLNLDERGQFKSPTELASLWAKIPSENLVFYCGSGVTACINLLAYAVMQRPLPKLYAGGWSDWCSYELYP